MNEVFKINFKSDGSGVFETNEPINYNEVDFNLNQQEGRYGRDLDFSGGEVDFDFTQHQHSEIYDRLVRYYKEYGFEADAELIIEKGSYNITGSIDFKSMEWKADNTFSCMVVSNTNDFLIKNRSNIEVDLFSDKNIDGETITPAPSMDVLIKAKPLRQTSVWENNIGEKSVSAASYDFGRVLDTYFNFSSNATKFEIEDSLYFTAQQKIVSEAQAGGIYLMRNFELINSKTTLNNVKVKFEFNGSTYDHAPQMVTSNSQKLYVEFYTGVKPVDDNIYAWNALRREPPYLLVDIDNQPTTTVPLEDFEISLGLIRTGESLFVAFHNVFGANEATNFQTYNVNYKNIKITVYAESVSYDTKTPAVRLDHAVQQVVKSMNGATVEFPLTTAGNLLRNTYLFSGNMFRGFQDKPFNISFDNIKDWFKELNLDYEVLANGNVYIDTYEAFYPENEVMCIKNIQYDDYTENFNLDYCINKFTFKYEKYQSKKDTKIEGTIDNVHGEAEFSLVSKKANEEKVIEIPFARDPYLIEETKRNTLKETTTTATNDDDTVFIVDCKQLSDSDRDRTISTNLLHEVYDDEVGPVLKLSNDGSFRFDLLGVYLASIDNVPGNNGDYTVIEITANDILLRPLSFTPTFKGQAYTIFNYYLDPFILWQNKTLDPDVYEAENLFSPYSFSNIDFTIKSNIQRSWLRWLAAANMYNLNKPFSEIKLSKYINNKDLKITRKSDSVIVLDEGANITTAGIDPIIDTIIVNCTLIVTFEQFVEITSKMRSSERGYLRIFDTENNVLLIYPKTLTLTYLDDFAFNLRVTGERKYMYGKINVVKGSTLSLNGVLIDNYDVGTAARPFVTFYDSDELAIYSTLNYQNISINGVFYTDYGAFKDAL